MNSIMLERSNKFFVKKVNFKLIKLMIQY